MQSVLTRLLHSLQGGEASGPPRADGERNTDERVVERITRSTAHVARGGTPTHATGAAHAGMQAVPPLTHSAASLAGHFTHMDDMAKGIDQSLHLASGQAPRRQEGQAALAPPSPAALAPAPSRRGPDTSRRFAPASETSSAPQAAVAEAAVMASDALDSVMTARMGRSASPSRPRRNPPSVPGAGGVPQQRGSPLRSPHLPSRDDAQRANAEALAGMRSQGVQGELHGAFGQPEGARVHSSPGPANTTTSLLRSARQTQHAGPPGGSDPRRHMYGPSAQASKPDAHLESVLSDLDGDVERHVAALRQRMAAE